MRGSAWIIFASLLIILPPLSQARTGPESEYREAKDAYIQLQRSSKKQLYRQNWSKVIDQFLAVAETYPDHPRAADALYSAGKACRGLHRISQVPGDALRAIEYFDALVRQYPNSTLADDVLVFSAEIFEKELGDPGQAYLLYRRAVNDYPDGDMHDTATRRLADLAQFAPPKPAPPKVETTSSLPSGATEGVVLNAVRYWSNPGYTRVVFDLSDAAVHDSGFLPGIPGQGIDPRIYIDIDGTVPAPDLDSATVVDDGLLRRIRTGRPRPGVTRVVIDLLSYSNYKVFPLKDPFRIVVDVMGEGGTHSTGESPEIHKPNIHGEDRIAGLLEQAPKSPPLMVNLQEGKTRKDGLRIVVDAGHGGKDPGAIGPSGVFEKDVCLALAKELSRQLEKGLKCEVILTRDKDIFLPLEERTAIANKVGADLFISIHANASHSRQVTGIETYYLNFSKNDQAVAVAARENGITLKEVGDLELILFDLMANSKINESSRLAAEIQNALVDTLADRFSDVKDLGVRQGPFYVLLGATMPSVLVETAFISNKKEEKRLTDRKYLSLASQAIVRGVKKYATALNLIAVQ